jgi:hypothetical protein
MLFPGLAFARLDTPLLLPSQIRSSRHQYHWGYPPGASSTTRLGHFWGPHPLGTPPGNAWHPAKLWSFWASSSLPTWFRWRNLLLKQKYLQSRIMFLFDNRAWWWWQWPEVGPKTWHEHWHTIGDWYFSHSQSFDFGQSEGCRREGIQINSH